jgi:hypothetical protein
VVVAMNTLSALFYEGLISKISLFPSDFFFLRASYYEKKMNSSEYEELESYFLLKLKAKDEQLRLALLAQSEAEQNCFYAVAKLDEIRGKFKIEEEKWKEKIERAFMITDDVDREKWKEALIKFDLIDFGDVVSNEGGNNNSISMESSSSSLSKFRFEFQSNVLLLKKTKEEYLRMEKTLSQMEQENRKLQLKLKESNALLVSLREEELTEATKRNEALRRENLTISQECANANASLSEMKAEMMKWKRTAEMLMKEEEMLKADLFENDENDENIFGGGNSITFGGKKLRMRKMELSLEKALVAKEESEKKVKRFEEEIRKEKEEKERALRKEELASAALAACSVPSSSSSTAKIATKTTQTSVSDATKSVSRLSAASEIAELEKKIEQLECRNGKLTETLEKSEYEHAREVALLQSEHERMLAVVSNGRLM